MTDRDTCFLDVTPARWSYEAVSAVSELGLLVGDMDGYFHPEAGVSRRELALILTLVVHTEAAAEALPRLSG